MPVRQFYLEVYGSRSSLSSHERTYISVFLKIKTTVPYGGTVAAPEQDWRIKTPLN